MKKLFGFILSICLMVLVVVGLFIYLFTDNGGEMDVDQIDPTLTTETIVSSKFNDGFQNMKDTYSIDVNFTESELNTLLYNFVKKNINSDYDPKNGKNDQTKYVKEIIFPTDIPVVGGKKAIIKHLYGTINEDKVTINMTFKCFGINMRIYFTFNITETEESYVLNIEKAYFSKISLTSSVFKKAFVSMESTINEFFNTYNLPFTFNVNNMNLITSKETLSNYINSLVEDDSESTMLKSFMEILFSSKNEMLKFGVFEEKFGLKLNLEKLKVNEKDVVLNEAISASFNQEVFIKEKSQNLIINSLVGNNEIDFTEIELSQLIYDKTNGYKDFALTYELLNGVIVNFKVDGITLDIDDTGENVILYFILNINGLKTLATYRGTVNQESDSKITITMSNDIILGQNLAVDSSFIKPILASSLSDSAILKYDETTNSFIISSNVFEEFLSSTLLSSKLEVTKVKMAKDKLVIYVESSDVLINTVIKASKEELNNCLSGDFLDSTKFDVSSNDQQEALDSLNDSLTNVKDKINNNTLDETSVKELVESINNLNDNNKQELFNQLKGSSSSDAFETLYNELFNK
ncbi:MAG: hypothetical protein MRZ17_01120 [Acholeplasmataceae bacterium]|nr:hypothetical protein [Acholeplasmataceae bacterium]